MKNEIYIRAHILQGQEEFYLFPWPQRNIKRLMKAKAIIFKKRKEEKGCEELILAKWNNRKNHSNKPTNLIYIKRGTD